ncbi:MAG: 50S ribosomal protein L1 [Synergistales bacterium]|nr:50S ribosomal protein L1 [Synergistales bacterium]
MAKRSKRYKELLGKIDTSKAYGLEEAIGVVKELATAKFDESLELHVRLGVDPRHADQQVRSTVVLPHGTGITKRVLVIASGEKVNEAEEAGADYVGGEDMVQRIQGGWMDFDAVIATPDMMKLVGRLGRILGPRGLMPSAKAGTTTFEVADAIGEVKAGRVEFRVDRFGIIHNSVGKMSFEAGQLQENVATLLRAIQKARPAAAKGQYVKSAALSSTMSPGIDLDTTAVFKEIAL